MGQGVHVQDLPGIGKRYDIDLGHSDHRVSVVVRNDGMRDLYVFDSPKSEPTVIELSEEQARKVAAVLSATFFGA